jgi:hypothetical protein
VQVPVLVLNVPSVLQARARPATLGTTWMHRARASHAAVCVESGFLGETNDFTQVHLTHSVRFALPLDARPAVLGSAMMAAHVLPVCLCCSVACWKMWMLL